MRATEHFANALQLGTCDESLAPLMPEAGEQPELSPDVLPAVLGRIEQS